MKNYQQYYNKYLEFLEKNNLYPNIYQIKGASTSPEVMIGDKKFISFSSNNYLGIAGSEIIKKSVIEGIKKYGIGSGSTRLLSGTLDIQVEFEHKLANFLDKEESITFSSGYLANVGVIRMLIDPFPYFTLSILGEKGGIIISDELNHASIIDGIRLAKAKHIIYGHSNLSELESILQKYKKQKKLIITDGVFSMDGDIAKLKEISALAEIYDAIIMVDDAHGLGVLGSQGQGTAHYLGVDKNIDVIMGSFTKAFGSIGGSIASSKSLTNYLRITARSYIFSDPIIPAIVSGLIETLKIIKDGGHLRKKVLNNSDYLRTNLKKLGFLVLGEDTTITPLLIGSEEKAIKFSDLLYKNGVLAPCIRRPAVVPGKERIRFSLMATHTNKHMDFVLSICEDIGRSLKLIP